MTDRVAYACEVCGSADRVSYHGMDSTLLCWKHMLEANQREDAAADASSNSAANEGADYVIADAIRRRIPDFRMPELMAWDIIRALEQASLTIGRSIPNSAANLEGIDNTGAGQSQTTDTTNLHTTPNRTPTDEERAEALAGGPVCPTCGSRRRYCRCD